MQVTTTAGVARERRWSTARRRCSWLLVLLVLAACSRSAGPPSADPAATATRAAELAQLTQVAGTIAALSTPATPHLQPTAPTGVPASPTRVAARTATTVQSATSTPTGSGAPAVSMIPLAANDLVYDPHRQRLYASVPGRAGPQGNSLVAIDPLTGTLGTPVALGSEPNRLALSDDGRYLYAGLDGASAIRRYDVTRGQADLTIALDGGPNAGPCSAANLAVVPDLAEIVAVAQVCTTPGRGAGVAAYHGTTKLPSAAVPAAVSGDIAFCGGEHRLYSDTDPTILHVDDAGITVAGTQPITFTLFGAGHQMRCDGARLYASSGEVIDVRTGARAGKYPGLNFDTLVCPDATVGRVFFLDLTTGPTPRLFIYDQTRFTLLAELALPSVPKPNPGPIVRRQLVRWGADGLAFLTADQLVLVRSPLISGRTATPAAVATAPAPTAARTPTPARAVTGTPTGAVSSKKVALVTNDLVYDPGTKKIYASVPGSAGPNGNSIVPIDPTTGVLGTPIFVGSEPTTLALSDDGQYLYVALSGVGAIRRVNLATQQAELQFDVGGDPREGPYTPGDIAVMPGHPDTVAVVLLGRYNYTQGVALFVNGVKRPNEPAYPASRLIGAIEFCDAATALYGYDTGDTGAGFYWLAVDADGITAVSSQQAMFGAFGDMVCDGGRIYATSGQVLDPVAQRLVGTCAINGLVRPDSTLGRIFYLTGGPGDNQRVVICDQHTFTQVASFSVPAFPFANRQHGFIRWGPDGLAYRGGPGELVLVQSPLVAGQP